MTVRGVPKLLHRMVEEAAERQADAPAIRCDGETLSYEQLARRVNGLARVLVGTGFARGDRVAVWLARGPNVPVGFYGVLAAGGTLVPIDPRSPIEQVVRILRATGATRIVAEPERSDAVCRALADCPEVSHAIGLEQDAGVPVPCVPWTTVLDEAGDRPPDVPVIDLDTAYILHTSGSTGLPKLILHTHYSAMSFVDWAAAGYTLDERRSPDQPLVASHLLRHLRLLRGRARGRDDRHPDAGGSDDARQSVGAPRAGADHGLVLGACRPRPAVAARRSRRAGPAFDPLGALRRRNISRQASAPHPPAASRRPLQPCLRFDRGQRVHLLPPARDGRAGRPVAHRPRVCDGAHARR